MGYSRFCGRQPSPEAVSGPVVVELGRKERRRGKESVVEGTAKKRMPRRGLRDDDVRRRVGDEEDVR
jgi:hypothetical protein